MKKWISFIILLFACRQETLIYSEEQQKIISIEIYVIENSNTGVLRANSNGKYNISTQDTITIFPRFIIQQNDSSYLDNGIFDSFQNYFWFEKNNLDQDIVYQKDYTYYSPKAKTEEIIFTIVDAVGDTLSTNIYLDINDD